MLSMRAFITTIPRVLFIATPGRIDMPHANWGHDMRAIQSYCL